MTTFNKEIRESYQTLSSWRNFRIRLFIESILVGLIAGLIVVLFRFTLEATELLRSNLYRLLHSGDMILGIGWFLILLIIAYLLGFIIKIEPMSGGSGIPQVKGAILGLLKMNWLKILIAKFIGGVLAIGSGLSLGREGPSIQIGAVVGQGLSRMLGKTRMEERYLLTSGASAGLAAAFNAPLAGAFFSLEELHKNFSPAVLMSAISASLTADFVVRYFYGKEPFWNFIGIPVLPFQYYGYLAILGIITGLLGIVFNKVLLKSLDIYAQQSLLPRKFQSAFPLIIGGVTGFILPEILGGGNHLIDTISSGQVGVMMLLILLVGKFLFTMISYGSGVPGGIFLPMLVIGALIGGIFSNLILFLGFNHDYHTTFMILAMAAYFTAIVKAPITGSVLVTEMTGSFSHLFEMMSVCMIAYIVADVAKSKPVYELLLERSLKQKDREPTRTIASKRTIFEFVVCLGSQLNDQRVKNIDWPNNCLLICIRRGEKEIVPKGDTKLIAGDYLYLSVADQDINNIKSLAGECNE